MGRVGYDSLEGILRVAGAGKKQPDPYTVDVLTYHAALELEMDHLLSLTLPRADRLAGGNLGFQHKISVVNGSWKGDPESGDNLATALIRFNLLRNSVAHSDSEKAIRGHHKKLTEATAALDGKVNPEATPYELAIRISAFMGDDPGAAGALKFMNDLDELVNVTLPASLGGRKTDSD